MFKAKEYIASLDAYNLSIELFSKSPATYANRAAVELKLNRWDDAHADCTKALELDPKFLKALMRRGAAGLELDRPEAALKDLTTALELDPTCKEVLNLKQKAERAVQKRQEQNSKDLQAGSKRISIEEVEGVEESHALLELENKTNQKVVEAPETCIIPEEDPYVPMRSGPMIIEEVVETEVKCDKEELQASAPKKGSDQGTKQVVDAEEAAEKERIAGNEHFKCKNYCAAIKCYDASLGLDPDVAATLSNRALCYLKLKDWNKAKSDCTEAIDLDLNYAKAYYRRGLASQGLGDLRAALKDLQAAHKLLPDDAEIFEKLKGVKRKLRVAFVKEVSREEAENQKKLDEACRSPSMHEIKTQIATVESAAAASSKKGGDESSSNRSPRKNNNNVVTKTPKITTTTTLPSKPRTATEFQRSCERLQEHPELLRKFISSIKCDEYPGIFKDNLSSEILRIVLNSLQVAFMPHDPAGTMAVLGGLVKVKRFGLILKLLSSSEKNTFLSIFDWLRDSCGAPLDRAQELKAQFY